MGSMLDIFGMLDGRGAETKQENVERGQNRQVSADERRSTPEQDGDED